MADKNLVKDISNKSNMLVSMYLQQMKLNIHKLYLKKFLDILLSLSLKYQSYLITRIFKVIKKDLL